MVHDLENQYEIDNFALYLLKDMITRYYGARCDEHDPECVVCNAWAFFDGLEEIVNEVNEVNKVD